MTLFPLHRRRRRQNFDEKCRQCDFLIPKVIESFDILKRFSLSHLLPSPTSQPRKAPKIKLSINLSNLVPQRGSSSRWIRLNLLSTAGKRTKESLICHNPLPNSVFPLFFTNQNKSKQAAAAACRQSPIYQPIILSFALISSIFNAPGPGRVTSIRTSGRL